MFHISIPLNLIIKYLEKTRRDFLDQKKRKYLLLTGFLLKIFNTYINKKGLRKEDKEDKKMREIKIRTQINTVMMSITFIFVFLLQKSAFHRKIKLLHLTYLGLEKFICCV
uniref:Uncharacterized protein n=1 Tax=Micrurus corallinus TaxID=54390 RepID=A0A2D4H3R0_MICCO